MFFDIKNEFNINLKKSKKPSTLPEFQDIIIENEEFIRAFVAKRVWNVDDIEDVYQTTLLEAFRSYHNYRNEAQPKTWICGVAANVICNYVRKKIKNEADLVDDIDPWLDTTIAQEDQQSITFRNPESSYELTKLFQNVDRSYQRLPNDIRKVFDSIVEEGISYQLAAEIHNIPIGTVRSRVSRAREIMRSSCKKHIN